MKVWTTTGMTAPYVPYGGSNYTLLFTNNASYNWMTGRIYYTLNISQVHRGILDFSISRYGGSLNHIVHGSFVSFHVQTNIDGNASKTGIVWTNTNGSSWGNGTMHMTVITNGGAMVSSYGNHYNNFTNGNNDVFLQETIS